jgi:invasin-like protein
MTRRRTTLTALALCMLLALVPASASGATITVSGTVSATGTKWQFKQISVSDNGTVSATLTWTNTSAKLLVGLSQKNGTSWTWISGKGGAQPVTMSWPVTPGTWRLAVEALSGSSAYTLTASYPTSAPPGVSVALTPPSITADGTSTSLATATVNGQDGQPAIGATVDFTSSDPGETIGPVTDNGDGTYSATITASTTAGFATITATDESASPTMSGQATLTQVSNAPPQITLVFSRTELSAADQASGGEFGKCTRDDQDIAPLDTVVGPYVQQNYPNVHLVGSIETGPTQDTGHWCPHAGKSWGPSWADLTALQNMGWSFIDHSATYTQNWSALTPQQQYDETCGSRDVITAHGLNGANGQFEWPNNSFDSTVNTNYVQKCFSFSRAYGTGITSAPQVLKNNGRNSTIGVSGGHCNVSGLPCTTVNTVKAYTLPSTIISKINNLKPGQWLSLQTYVLVTNTNPVYTTNKTQWDCTNSDPRYHWTNDVERYCWSDLQTILAAINSNTSVEMNSPSAVASTWGWPPPPQ